jgi:hypothetical protein
VLPEGRVRTPEATDGGAGIPAVSSQSRETRERSETGSTDAKSGTLQNVAQGAMGSDCGGRKQRVVDADTGAT